MHLAADQLDNVPQREKEQVGVVTGDGLGWLAYLSHSISDIS